MFSEDLEAVRLKAILNDLALSGGKDPSCVGTRFDVLRFDVQGLVALWPGRCRRLNATYAHSIPGAAGPRGLRVKCRLG